MTSPAVIHWLRGALLGAIPICVGCPGTLDDPSRFLSDTGGDGGACRDVPSSVFVPTCAHAGCHSTADKSQGLDLESPGVAARLVGVCAPGGGVFVDPANPSLSVIYTKLTLTPPFGTRMPLGRAPLDAPTIACVLAWASAQQGSARTCGDDSGATLDAAGTAGPREGGD